MYSQTSKFQSFKLSKIQNFKTTYTFSFKKHINMKLAISKAVEHEFLNASIFEIVNVIYILFRKKVVGSLLYI